MLGEEDTEKNEILLQAFVGLQLGEMYDLVFIIFKCFNVGKNYLIFVQVFPQLYMW